MVNTQDLAPLWSPLGLFLFGLCIGSFLNVVVRRSPLMLQQQWWTDTAWQLGDDRSLAELLGADAETATESQRRRAVAEALQARLHALDPISLSHPRSHCPPCGHRLRWHENLPVLGWLRLKGRCSSCGVPIPLRYPLVELGTAGLFLTLGWRHGFGPEGLLWSAWAATLLALTLIDWDTTLLPDGLTQPLLWSGLAAAVLGWTLPVAGAVWGAMLGYASLWLVAAVFRRLSGKEGMGQGDFKLLAALGAWLGASMLLPVVLVASLSGAAVGLVLKARGLLREGRYVPFGPFLALGGLVVHLLDSTTVKALLGWP